MQSAGIVISAGTVANLLTESRTALADILTQFCDYYRELLASRDQPTTLERARLDADFDALFGTKTG